jgi:hypothetical protein
MKIQRLKNKKGGIERKREERRVFPKKLKIISK